MMHEFAENLTVPPPLEQEAFSSENELRKANRQVDDLIEYASGTLVDHNTPFEQRTMIFSFVQQQTTEIMQSIPPGAGDNNFTDYHRLAATAQFTEEKILAPLLFRANTPPIKKFRTELVNGSEGKSVELIEILLQVHDLLRDGDIPLETLQRLRGAIRESTSLALVNQPQDGYALMLPSSFDEDTTRHTDFNLYYIAQDGRNSFKIPVSNKTHRRNAYLEKEAHPNLLVLCASDYGNVDLSVSRLLAKKHRGKELTSDEENKLTAAQAEVFRQIEVQLPHIVSEPLARHAAQDVTRLMRRIAMDRKSAA